MKKTINIDGVIFYSQSEVDTIRKEAFLDSRRGYRVLQDKDGYMVGDFIYPTVEGYLKTFEHLSSLNNSSSERNLWTPSLEEKVLLNNGVKATIKSLFSYKRTAGVCYKNENGETERDEWNFDAMNPIPEQPSNDNAFVWTDDLIADLIFNNHWVDTPYPYINKFKQSKQPLSTPIPDNTVDWEIVSFAEHLDKTWEKSGYIYLVINGMVGCFSNAMSVSQWIKTQPKIYSIHSVRRISTGEIFTIGDNVNYGVIEKIIISWVGLEVQFVGGNGSTFSFINKLPSQPLPTDTDTDKPVMFTTEDGVEITDDNLEIYSVCPKSSWETMVITYKQLNWRKKRTDGYSKAFISWKHFYSKEKRAQYIFENKPCLSLADLKNSEPVLYNAYELELKEIVNKKNNNQ